MWRGSGCLWGQVSVHAGRGGLTTGSTSEQGAKGGGTGRGDELRKSSETDLLREKVSISLRGSGACSGVQTSASALGLTKSCCLGYRAAAGQDWKVSVWSRL